MALKLSVLLIASPNPGVSTTVRRNFTPLSSISTVDASNSTVFVVLSTASATFLFGYKSVRNRLLTKVDLPRPDSPTTINVNSNPFFTDFLCT
uniref:Uncharacterized protein n=1 Tax=Panstrongylus lignarius TaxID=156445 RepID=A0A224XRG8_9HEMI